MNSGLCTDCRHARTVDSSRGSSFLLCLRSETDARFQKYPSLPVRQCAGHEARPTVASPGGSPRATASPEPARAAGGRFPTTHGSAVLGIRSEDTVVRERAMSAIAEAYWKPVYKYIRMRWNKTHEDAADLTQGFFGRVIEKSYLASFDPAKGRFRTFLRTCLDGYLANEHASSMTQKRGGDLTFVSFDFQAADSELSFAVRSEASGSGSGSALPPGMEALSSFESAPDAYFDREWLRSFFQSGVDELRRRSQEAGRMTPFRAFERYDLEVDEPAAVSDRAVSGEVPVPTSRVTYEELGRELGIPATSVTNALSSMRRELREILLEKLRELTTNDEEFRHEVRGLFGGRPQ